MQKQWLKEREIGMQTLKNDGEERDSESYKLTSDVRSKREECAKSCMRNVVKLFD